MKKIFVSIALFVAASLLTSKIKATTKTAPATLEEALERGYVVINHPKIKGGRSQHIATRNVELMPEGAIKGTGEAKNGVIAYYAIDVKGWRCVSTREEVLADTQWTWIGDKLPA